MTNTNQKADFLISTHIKMGVVLVLIAYLYLVLYLPQVDSQQLALTEDDGLLASAGLKFTSFMFIQMSVIFCVMMVIYKSSICRIVAACLLLFGELLMVVSLVTYTARLCSELRRQAETLGISSKCPTILDYKVGMLAIGVLIGVCGAVFLLVDYCIKARNKAPSVEMNLIPGAQPVATTAHVAVVVSNPEEGQNMHSNQPIHYQQPPTSVYGHTPDAATNYQQSNLQSAPPNVNQYMIDKQDPPPPFEAPVAYHLTPDMQLQAEVLPTDEYLPEDGPNPMANTSRDSEGSRASGEFLPAYAEVSHLPEGRRSPFSHHTPVQSHYQY